MRRSGKYDQTYPFRTVLRSGLVLAVLLLAGTVLPTRAVAADLPEGFAETRVARGLDPTGFVIAPDGRLFVIEKSGRIRIVKNDVLLEVPFANVTTENYNEQGLIGIALDPAFTINGYVYVIYTVQGEGQHNRISRFTAAGDVAVGGETILFELSPRTSGVHNGGGIAFGPDGKLYVGTGDDGSGNNAQSSSTLHGKVLRLNADGAIPHDNPNPLLPAPYSAIWASGLRNPFQISFQAATGRLFINDVGQVGWEEINEGMAGANYGWPNVEGRRVDQAVPPVYRDPVYAYGHDAGCSITAGAFYDPPSVSFPTGYEGRYFYADYCGGYIKLFDPENNGVSTFATGINRPLSVRVAGDGSLYYIARSGLGGASADDNTSSLQGEIYHVRYTSSTVPTISAPPDSQTVAPGQAATFVVAASGSDPLVYQWRRNNSVIPGATGASYTTPPATPLENGDTFSVAVSNADGLIVSAAATLTVAADNAAPTPVINTPPLNARYRAGDVLTYSGEAVDPEDGPLPASGLTWWIEFHHDTHTHPALGEQHGVAASTFEILRVGETASNVWFRIYLRATDSGGRSTTITRDVRPETSTLTLVTDPSGLTVLVDGQPVSTPVTITGVVGITRMLDAPTTLRGATTNFAFSGWSDGTPRQHSFDWSAKPSTLVAIYEEIPTIGRASGLLGEYFDNIALANVPALTRREAVNFAWGRGSPAPEVIGADDFAVRWTGDVEAPVSGDYVFSTVSDDGVRLWIDGQLLIDNWTTHPPRVDYGLPVRLEAGRRYRIKLEYFERKGDAEVRLRWRYPGETTIPMPVPMALLSAPSGE